MQHFAINHFVCLHNLMTSPLALADNKVFQFLKLTKFTYPINNFGKNSSCTFGRMKLAHVLVSRCQTLFLKVHLFQPPRAHIKKKGLAVWDYVFYCIDVCRWVIIWMDGKSPKLLMFSFSAFVLYSTTIFMNPSLCSAIAYSRLLFATVGHWPYIHNKSHCWKLLSRAGF